MHYFIWTNVAFVSVGFVAATNWTNLDHSLWPPLTEKSRNTTKLLFACQATNNCINYACSEIFSGPKMLPQMHRWKALGNCCHKQENSGSAELGAWSSAVWWQQPFIFDGECWQNSWTPIPPLTICACKIWEFISLFCHRRVFAYPISLFGGDDGMGMGNEDGDDQERPSPE